MSNSITYQGRTFTDNEIAGGSASLAKSLDLRELTVDSAQFTLRPNLSLDFFTAEPFPLFTRERLRFKTSEANPFSGGVAQNAEIHQYLDGSQIAVWHTQSIERLSGNLYKISVFSPLGLLTQKTHYGGIYTGQTVASVVAGIMGNLSHYIAPVFRDVALYGWLPIAPARDNLIQVLFAINASLATDPEGTIRIENLPSATGEIINAADIYESGASVEYNAPVTSVTVLEHNYSVGSETKKLFEGAATAGQTITFGEPMANLSWHTDDETPVEMQITESGANYAVLSAGTGVLTGTPYLDMTREISRLVTIAQTENEIRIEKATLVGTTAVADVANRLQEYYRHQNHVRVSVAGKLPSPGEVISVFDPFDRQMVSACVASNDFAISAISKSSISALVGFTPWQVVPFVDVHEIITETGPWTAPASLPAGTEIQVVVIGGGDGGTNGADGEDGTQTRHETKYGKSVSFSRGTAGAGGDAGVAGIGGKILRGTITVTGGDVLQAVIGAGGTAGGGTGGVTTFGTLSSADGAVAADGYTDPITGETLATTGTAGIAGGNGGDGGSGGSNGSAGGDAGENTGGAGGAGRISDDPTFGSSLRRGGGGGGGAAFGANGAAGNAASSGSGADAAQHPAASHYGEGGAAGNGGGGGGGTGALSASESSATTWTINVDAGLGGKGSEGRAGMQGCVILIYRQPILD